MAEKPTYEELEEKVKELENPAIEGGWTEAALRESEELFRNVYDTAPLAFVVWDLDTRVTDWNKKAEEVFGWSKEEALGQDFFDFLIPEKDRPHVENVVDSLLKGELPSHSINDNLTKDGQIITCGWNNSPLHDDDGNIVGAISLALDITERKQVEKALRESEERYKQLWNDAPVAYHTLDANGIILQVNQTEMGMLGYTTDEMVGKPIFEFILPEQRKDAEARFRLKLAGRHVPKQDDRIYLRKDGSRIWVSIDDKLEHDTDGEVLGIRTIMVDVSEQKKAEEAVRESEKKYSTLVENSLTGIYMEQDKKIVFANRRFAKIFRYRKNELLGIQTWRLIHPKDRTLTNMIRDRRLKGQSAPEEYEARGLTKDGETIWINRRNTCIEYEGKPAILGNIVDITEQKRAQQELQKINEELKNFVDVVSHDLKTPIIAIQGFSTRLLNSYQEDLGEKGKQYISHIQLSARRMEGLVSDLLTLKRIERVTPKFAEISCSEIVNNVASSLQDRLKEKGVKLVVQDNLPAVFFDAQRIYQVFENLVVNAMKFMGDTERPEIEVGYESKAAFHQFYVRDNGIGIDPKYHSKVFQMFRRLDEIEDKEGTGLGLAIVKRIVDSHGGKVWVESEKGEGATFNFTLPKTA
jgi:PAS domain S-box-containing protein